LELHKKKIFIIAGENSGDLHASNLIKSIKENFENIDFYGVGGKFLSQQGVKLVLDYKNINYIGFYSVIKNYRTIKNYFGNIITEIKKLNPDVLILVDFPGFNLRIAKLIRNDFKGKIIYYISPQLWAWNKSRVKIIKENVDRMLVTFPFEVDFYKKEGVLADFVGNPLIPRINKFIEGTNKIKKGKKQITLMPGSRIEEINHNLPKMLKPALFLANKFDAKLYILCSDNIDKSFLDNFILNNNIEIIKSNDSDVNISYNLIYNSDLIFTKSGTSTLECCLLNSPFFTVYDLNFLNYQIGKRVINVDYISIVNILAGKQIVKEFIYKDFNNDNLIKEGERILSDSDYVNKMLNNFILVKDILTKTKPAVSADEIICNYLR
jgi:lipid-A-disaccharide synthase